MAAAHDHHIRHAGSPDRPASAETVPVPARPGPAAQKMLFTEAGDLALDIDEMVLAALPNAVGVARQFTLSLLRKWKLEELAEGSVLVISELLTNAIKVTGNLAVPASYIELHADAPANVALRLVATVTYLVVEVWDSSADAPQLSVPDEAADHGRGLVLTAAFTDKWGHYPSPGGSGKVVWGRFPIPDALRPARAGLGR